MFGIKKINYCIFGTKCPTRKCPIWDKWGEILAETVKKDDTLINILKIIAPGTKFREGLDNILKAKTGALIIIGDSKEIMDIVDGRF